MKPLALPRASNPAAQAAFVKMRRFATGLLIVMAAIYVGARYMETHAALSHPDWASPVWGFVRAFAEAGMVGGLADWFAVTALFRHPLGLPIPHTAIIPRKKDQIGDTLAQFLKDNFLLPAVIARRMRGMDVAGAIGRFLVHPTGGAGRLRYGASRLIGDVIDGLDQERIGGIAKAALKREMGKLNAGPLLGQLLEAAMKEGKHRPVLDAVILWAARTLEAHEQTIRDLVKERANSILRWTGLDAKVSNAIINGLMKLLADMAEDPDHPLRDKGEEALANLAQRMQHDPEMQAKVEEWKAQLLANPALNEFTNTMWESARQGLLRAARDPQGAFAGQLGEMLVQIGGTLQSDARLARQINRFARRAIVGASASYGDQIVTLISDTVRGWDAGTITDRVEQAVGRDLQYIRINGTLVGGFVGLTLHSIGLLF